MPVTFTSAQIEQFKLRAKYVSRSSNTPHSEALDQIARENGFSNWSLLMKHAFPTDEIQRSPKSTEESAPLGSSSTVDRLVAIGFRHAGRWTLPNRVLRLELEHAVMHEQNVLYAFVVNGTLMYVGKTTQSLIKRMQGYRSPATNAERGGSTNIKNNRNIVDALATGASVHIYVLHTLPIQHHGEFPVNLAAGLEDTRGSSLSSARRATTTSLLRKLMSRVSTPSNSPRRKPKPRNHRTISSFRALA